LTGWTVISVITPTYVQHSLAGGTSAVSHTAATHANMWASQALRRPNRADL